MQNILSSIEDIFNENAPCVFIEVIKATSGTPSKAGFKMIVNENGRVEGSVGGGVLEQTCIDIAKKMIFQNEKASVYTFNLKNDIPTSTEKGLILENENLENKDNYNQATLYAACGGQVTIFFEYHDLLTLSIFGAGHIGENLIDIIKQMGYKIQLFDVREDTLNRFENNKEIKTFLLKPINKDNETLFFVDEKPLSAFLQNDSYIVITTHGHTYDFSIAKYIFSMEKKFKYVGMVGSKIKIKGFLESLKKESNEIYDKLLSSNFYSPIGLDIGGVSAREIALSIAAQIQSVRYGKNNNNLSVVS